MNYLSRGIINLSLISLALILCLTVYAEEYNILSTIDTMEDHCREIIPTLAVSWGGTTASYYLQGFPLEREKRSLTKMISKRLSELECIEGKPGPEAFKTVHTNLRGVIKLRETYLQQIEFDEVYDSAIFKLEILRGKIFFNLYDNGTLITGKDPGVQLSLPDENIRIWDINREVSGTWTVEVIGEDIPPGGTPFDLMVWVGNVVEKPEVVPTIKTYETYTLHLGPFVTKADRRKAEKKLEERGMIFTELTERPVDLDKVQIDEFATSGRAYQEASRIRRGGLPIYVKILPTGKWAVQVGAFAFKENAERILSKMRKLGYSEAYMIRESADIPLYKLRIGEFTSREDAESVAIELIDLGYPIEIITIEITEGE